MNKILLSVVICSYNRCKSLESTLESLVSQENDGSFDYEILLVDNNSSDKTRETVESFYSRFDGKLKYFFEGKQGKSLALNHGVAQAKGDIVVFTDDDVIIDKKWLRSIALCNQKYHFDAMGGRVLPSYPDHTPKWIKDNKDVLYGPIVAHDYGEVTKPYDAQMVPLIGANMAIRKELFGHFGLFREDMGPGFGTKGEETDYIRRLEKGSKKIYYCGQALAWHGVEKERMNLGYIASWGLGYGKYNVLKDMGKVDPGIVCLFGIPRYLFRRTVLSGFALFTGLFNMRKFLQLWRDFFCNIGMVIGYRIAYQNSKTQGS